MEVLNKEKFYSQTIEKRYFEVEDVYYPSEVINVQPVQINNPVVHAIWPRNSASSYIALTESQYGDGIDITSVVAKFGDEYYFSRNYQSEQMYTISGTSITAFDIAATATSANKIIAINRNFLIFPRSITASCDWIVYKSWIYQMELTFNIPFDKSKIKHLYTNNFTFYNNSITGNELQSLITDKMAEEGFSVPSSTADIYAYSHNYFIPESIHESKMYISGIVLYNSDKEAMAIITFKYPILLPNNTGISFIPRVIW